MTKEQFTQQELENKERLNDISTKIQLVQSCLIKEGRYTLTDELNEVFKLICEMKSAEFKNGIDFIKQLKKI